MTTAFVLSGGASLGAIQVGMLQALAERRIKPDLVIGTSVGAFNAAWIASQPDRSDELAEIWRGLRRQRLFPVDPVGSVLGLLGRRNYLVSPAGLRELLERHLSFDRLEDALIPLHVVATELTTGREVLLSRGSAVDAILASAAIPGIYPPVRIRGRELIDGGVSDHTPIAQAIALGATTIYVLPTGYACALVTPPSTPIGMILHALTLVIQQRLIADIREHEEHCDLHVLPPLCPLEVSPAEFDKAGELIKRAYESTASWLASARRRHGQAALLGFHSRHRSKAP
jgi:NTE family protein